MDWVGPATVYVMWVACQCGRRHFGPYGAAGLILRNADGHLLMTHRSEFVHFGGTWSFPGGAIEEGETPVDAAVREVGEELGIPSVAVDVVTTLAGLDHGVWRYTYVLADLNPQWSELELRVNWEATDVAWVQPRDMIVMTLHPDLRNDLDRLFTMLAAADEASPPIQHALDAGTTDALSP